MNTTIASPAAQVIIAVIPIVGIVIGGTVIFFYLLWRHSEKKLQIKNGNYKKESFNFKVYSLLIGLLLSFVGLVLTVFFALMSGKSAALLGGLIPLSLGLSLLVFYKLNPDFLSRDAD